MQTVLELPMMRDRELIHWLVEQSSPPSLYIVTPVPPAQVPIYVVRGATHRAYRVFAVIDVHADEFVLLSQQADTLWFVVPLSSLRQAYSNWDQLVAQRRR